MSFEFTILVVVSILVIAATVGRWKSQIGLARGTVYSKRVGAIKISSNIRHQAKQTFLLKKAINEGKKLIDLRREETDKLLGELSIVDMIDDRIVIIDDRRGRKETQFSVTVLHSNYNGLINPLAPIEHHNGWKNGKPCVFWAADGAAAIIKAKKIFLGDEGFVISGAGLFVSSTSFKEVGNG